MDIDDEAKHGSPEPSELMNREDLIRLLQKRRRDMEAVAKKNGLKITFASHPELEDGLWDSDPAPET